MRRCFANRLRRYGHGAATGVLLFAAGALNAEIIDGIAATVGSKTVTHSEIKRELRLEGLFNAIEMDTSASNRRTALQRLIERRLIQQDIDLASFLIAGPEEVEEQMRELRAMRFAAGRDFPAALQHYGLTVPECRDFLAEQISFERYVMFRFQTGLDATSEEIKNYHETVYSPRQQQLGEDPEALDEVSERIRRILIESRVDRLLDERVRELRTLTRVAILATELRAPR